MIRNATRALPALLLSLLAASPAAADPIDDLARLVRESSASPEAIMSLLRGIGSMPDFDLGHAEVERVLAAADVPQDGILRKVLEPTKRLVKRGQKLEIARSQVTKLAVGKGVLALQKKVEVRLRVQGEHDAIIDEIDGIEVGKSAGSLFGLGKLVFTRQDDKPVCKITAGPWPLQQTMTVDLTPKAKPTPGLVGSVTTD